MRVVLDTHVLLWASLEPERLGPTARDVLANPATELMVSSATAWEVMVLYRKGRIKLDRPAADWIDVALARRQVAVLPIDLAVVVRSEQLAGIHRDPADRFIIATALVHGCALVTVDGPITDWKGVPVIW